MAPEKNVSVQTMSTVVPSMVVAPAKIHRLSNLDYLMQLHTLRIVYYYTNCTRGSDLIESLKESLSQVLSDYPPATGRLQQREDGSWDVRCNDAGVRVLEAKANTTIHQWLKSVDRSSELKLAQWEDIGSDPSLSTPLYVQLTEFEEGGLAIGFSCAHLLADPSCATLMMKAWGEIHRGKMIFHPPFFHQLALAARPTTNTSTAAVEYYDSAFSGPPPDLGKEAYETVAFKFTEEMVKECIAEVRRGTHCDGRDVEPFEALAALFWVCCTKAKGTAAPRESHLSICSEFRKMIVSPLPHGYFGNALHFSGVSSGVERLASSDLSYPARLIHESIGRIDGEEVRSIVEWLETRKQKEGRLPPPSLLYGPHLTCANWEDFYTFEACFEEGKKPVHVSYHVEPLHGEGLILVLPAAEGNLHRTVMVTLPGSQIAGLCEDPAIRRFSPVVLMMGRLHGTKKK